MAYLKLSSSEASGKSEVYTNLYPNTNQGGSGDINGDGQTDITDVNAAIDMMLGRRAFNSALDMDGNGSVDISDVNKLIDKMLGK